MFPNSASYAEAGFTTLRQLTSPLLKKLRRICLDFPPKPEIQPEVPLLHINSFSPF